jgi:myosin heavy subunit
MKSFSKLKNKLKGKAKDVAKAKAGEVSAPAPTGVGRQSLDVSGAANTTDKNPGVLPNKRTMARNTDARYLADNAPVVTSSGSVKVEETRTTEVGDRVQLPESELLSSTSITAGADADSIHVASEPGLRSKTTSLIIRDTRRLQTRTTKDGPARDGLSPQRESSSVSTVKLNQKFNNIADLWSRAYDLLRSQNESLVKTYEEILATEVSEPASGMSNWMTLSGKEREVAMIELIEKQTQLQTHMKWRLRIGSRTIEFQEQFNRIVKLVVLAKDVVTSAVSPSPHAAIAWAGVCIILPVRLTFSSASL